MNVFYSFLLGLFFTVLLFFLCAFLVISAKVVIVLVKSKLPSPPPKVEEPTPPKPQKRNYKRARSIEINPDEVDRIYVKKIS